MLHVLLYGRCDKNACASETAVKIIIDRNRCEGKATCLDVCQEDVFELQKPAKQELGWKIRIKLKFHGEKQAFAVNPENCTDCKLCVTDCPEDAIAIEIE